MTNDQVTNDRSLVRPRLLHWSLEIWSLALLVISMLDNCPFRTLKHKDLTIEGYSRAAVQSYWRVPELKIGFDLGAQPWDFMGTPTWFVTHTHLDHIAALPVYVARRRMMKMEPPTIYVPGRGRRGRAEAAARSCSGSTAAGRSCDLRGVAAGRRDRAVARARRDGVRDDGTPIPSLRLRRLGAAEQAEGGVSRACPATRSATCGCPASEVTREVRDAAAGLHRRHQPRPAWTPTRRSSRRRC